MRIGFTYDLKTEWDPNEGDPKDINAEFDAPETIDRLEAAIVSGGHTVHRIGNVSNLLKRIDTLDVDIVFNVCEGRFGRNRESQVPILLEHYNIPYVGADALTLGLTLDKVMAKRVFSGVSIPTPDFFLVSAIEQLPPDDELHFPLIVKTRHEGSSKGLDTRSRVLDREQLHKRIKHIMENYQQDALVEQYIPGQEFTVAVLGNQKPVAMPVVQIAIDGQRHFDQEIYTHDLICSSSLEYLCPAPIDATLTKHVQDLAIRVFQAVDCRDMARIDFRVNRQGQPFVLEINPLPTLDETDVFHLFPKLFGLDFDNTVNIVIDLALIRYGLLDRNETQILKPFLTETVV